MNNVSLSADNDNTSPSSSSSSLAAATAASSSGDDLHTDMSIYALVYGLGAVAIVIAISLRGIIFMTVRTIVQILSLDLNAARLSLFGTDVGTGFTVISPICCT